MLFLTLSEQRVLEYVHISKGPNEVDSLGILQYFRDAIKLFTEEQSFTLTSNHISYYFAHVFGLFLSVLVPKSFTLFKRIVLI